MSTAPTLADSARATPNLWRFANIEFDERSFELRVGGVSVDVERAPLRVLRELLETPRELVSRERLLASVWKRKPETISRNALTNAIGKLRRAIGDEDQTLVVSSSGEGYRLEADVERRPLPSLQALNQVLRAGQAVPHRSNWMLRERIDATDRSEVWKVVHAKTHELRVFKFAGDSFQLAALRREVTISRLLTEALGPRQEFVRIHDWNFDQPPLFIESEYAGEDLRQWAIRRGGLNQVPLTERLAVMAELADAVALAHSVGALHKDLKPGNVAIQQDASGNHVRILDFGSGRLLDPDILDQFQITRMALPEADPTSGTPFYIAPELLSGAPPTIASDIYALGVLLYQFVVGDLQKPIAPGWEAEVADPLLREDIAWLADGNPAKRPATASVIAERLRQLDQRRQQRAAAEAEAARFALLQQRLEREQQRRNSLRLAVIVLVIGMAATLALYVQLLSVQRQRETARVQADQEAAASKEVTDYLLSLFDAASPEKTGGHAIEPRQLIDFGKERLGQQFADRPRVRARMMAALADLYCKLGDAEACRQQIEAALTLQRADTDADAQTTARLLQLKSHADALQIRDDDAESSLREALALIDGKPATDPVLLAQVLQELGTTLQREEKNADAVTALQRARALQRNADGTDTLAGMKTLMALSLTELDMGRSEVALALAEEVVKTTKAQTGESDLRYFDALMNLANVLMAKLHYADAEALMHQALAGYLKIYGRDARPVFETKSALVDLLNRQGRLRDATALATEVADDMRPRAGADDPTFAVALNDVGVMRLRYGDYAGALPWLRQAFQIVDHHFGSGSVQTIRIRHNLGLTLVLAGKPQEGVTLLQTEIPASLSGNDIDYSRGRRWVLIGEAQSAMGQFEQAQASFDQAEAQFKRIGDSGFDAASYLGGARGHLLAAWGRYAEALPMLEQTATSTRKLVVADDPKLLDVEVSIASCELHLGHAAEARKLLEEAGPLVDKELAPTHRAHLLLQRLRSELKTGV